MNVHQLRVTTVSCGVLLVWPKAAQPWKDTWVAGELSNSATSMTTGNAPHDTISEDSTLGVDLLYSEVDGSAQANEGEQVKRNKKDRHNSRYSLQPMVNAPRRFHRGSSSGRLSKRG